MNAPVKYAELQAPFEAIDLNVETEPRAEKRLLLRTLRHSAGTVAFVVSLFGFLIWAWLNRDNGVLTPKDGTGYWFGIVGASMMAIVLVYPLRKRLKIVRDWGELPSWFRWHMVLGLLGPALIIAHSTFSIHSMNALAAFVAMLVVAGSGLVGRYLYAQTHRGLYGAKVEAKEMLSEVTAIRKRIGSRLSDHDAWDERLRAFETEALVPSTTFGGALAQSFKIGRLQRETRKKLFRDLQAQLLRESVVHSRTFVARDSNVKHIRARVDRYFRTVRRAGNLAVYERFFALWHVMHLPLIVILVVTAVIHIVAVNMY
jgi:hypothetical protein